jgi:hypothetical protein
MTTTTLKPFVESIEIVVCSDDHPDPSYLEQEGWEERLKQYREGDFYFVGVYVAAMLSLRTPQGGWMRAGTIRTPGLWGIESDSGDDYIAEVAGEELDQLNEMLAALGIDTTDLPDPEGL